MSRTVQNLNIGNLDFYNNKIRSKVPERNVRIESKMYNAKAPEDPPIMDDADVPM